ncbi:MAG: isoleucine--tRNA ligase [Caldimicrobium sp.]|nr:isoleucine--tRNA ligase [Caldimicrobium sp.]MCX7873177.1 isoleucine--tRNA ligase [Caldimicrobium sp.]MDW8094244.1 isoleucine--tRNA ligase [Caldimicrobium sp.]
MDWKETLNLPKTNFPMKANLTEREPLILKFWCEREIYKEMLRQNKDKPLFVLHDGPPYANGHIHLGTALNKILKDIIVKSKFMMGYYSPFIPGWDCHGLPIELNVEKELKIRRGELSPLVVREACRNYAQRYVEIQREEFKRLGIFGDWDSPYLTMSYEYEATIAREFLKFLETNQVYKRKKPVFWCPTCVTALAEAEVEYEPHLSPSIYVKFPLTEKTKAHLCQKLSLTLSDRVFVLIWTTTPWTLPANLALAFNPEFDYLLIEFQEEYLILAEGRLSALLAELNVPLPKILAKFKGDLLEKYTAKHPLYERESLIVLADFVTLDTGTGIVHIAPGHGDEDYLIGLKYGLEIYTPVDVEGKFFPELPLVGGLTLKEANLRIVEELRNKGLLLHEDKISHSYPHCWRCKNPIIFRAEEQWFISMEAGNLRQRALKTLEEVSFIPGWGKNRLQSMLERRPDWCISRQRVWGVPIVVFRCKDCGEILKEFRYYQRVVEIFEREGCDPWFTKPVEEFLPEGTLCPSCHGSSFEKEKDILDVWFDSGVSFAGVLEKREELNFPADLYLEGSDQHRGWFQSSLLCSVGTRGKPPYKKILTHGFVVDGKGRKMSKSLGNVIHPQDLIQKYGAEIIRLWVSAEDYKDDIKISQEILDRLVESYRKIRNTCRFLLGNLYDFSPSTDLIPFESLPLFERFILYKLSQSLKKIRKAYEDFEFHIVSHEIHRFCTVELSSLLIDINRDYLYCEAPQSFNRRATQTVFYYALDTLVKVMAPILSFTAEEIWQNLPYPKEKSSVFLTELPDYSFQLTEEEIKRWDKIFHLREEFLRALEIARKDLKIIGSSLEAEVYFQAPREWREVLSDYRFWEYFLMVAKFIEESLTEEELTYTSQEIEGLKILVKPTKFLKCERCWQRKPEVGTLEIRDLCQRCLQVVKKRL